MALRFSAALAALLVASATAALAAPSLELRGGGSTFAAPLVDAWVKARAVADPSVAVQYQPLGSSAGLKKFVAGELEFAVTDRPLKADEAAHAQGGALSLPITAGMVVVPYHLPGVDSLKLSRAVLAGVFSGEITRWDDQKIAADNPGVKLPARDIAVVARREGSGTTFAFTAFLAAIDGGWGKKGASDRAEWPEKAMEVFGNEGVAARIAITDYSIGYVEYGFAQRLGLKTALLQNRDGAFVAADAQSGAAALDASGDGAMPAEGKALALDPAGAKAYPIVTFSWMVLHKSYANQQIAAAAQNFAAFGLSDAAQAKGAEIGYVALPQIAREKARDALGLGSLR